MTGITEIIAGANAQLLTHTNQDQKFDLSIFAQDLKEKSDLSLPFQEVMILLKQLSEFELGRFLLQNKGLNGYWTAYLIIHAPQKTDLSPLEAWMVHSSPVIKSTRERFGIFQIEIQKRLKNDMTIASMPCGLMDDLLLLDYTNFQNITLIGMDLDERSLTLAEQNAEKQGITKAEFIKKDAWNLEVIEEFDLIASNGINIYQPDDEKVVELYKEFYRALKFDGILVTSFLTPPPSLSPDSTWRNYNPADVLKQKAVLTDIIGVKWQVFRTEAKTRQQLEKAGFVILEVIYDSQGMFPTIIALKK
jgi:ubiquinone/menaquinone biosynthesis C-methylase UbiE